MTAILSSINLIAKNIDSDLYDNGEAFCRFHHSTIVGSRVLLLSYCTRAFWEVWDFTVPKRNPKNKIPTQTTVVVCRLPQGERHHSGWQFCMVFFESFGCSFNFYEKLRLKNNFVFFSLRIEKIFYQQRVKCFYQLLLIG